jgi:hypothetical protein
MAVHWRGAVAAVALIGILSGCDDKSSPSSIPDGVTTINKQMRGIWNAPGGTSCRWWMTSDGTITNNGNTVAKGKSRVQKSGRAADQSQSVIIGTGNIGNKIHSDGCGGWKK